VIDRQKPINLELIFIPSLMLKLGITLLPIILLCSACASQTAKLVRLSTDYTVGDHFMQITLRGTLDIPPQAISGLPLVELSGLAWDNDESVLYAVSDKGNIFHLQPTISGGLLKKVNIKAAYPLTDKSGKPLQGSFEDAEGIVLFNSNNGEKNDSQLLISFEGKPRLDLYSNKGEWIDNIQLPHKLKNIDHYQSGNKALEAVTHHLKFGTITAPEYSLKNTEKNEIILYSTSGRRWRITRYPKSSSALVALEFLPNGSLLLLERVFESALHPIEIVLRQTWLTPGCEYKKNTRCKSNTLAIFNSAKGWSIDNFEGLTHHKGNHFFMVSDNNDMWFQRTLLSYFEIMSKEEIN